MARSSDARRSALSDRTTTLDLGALLQRIALLAPQKIPAFRVLALEVLSGYERERLKAFPTDFKTDVS